MNPKSMDWSVLSVQESLRFCLCDRHIVDETDSF
jgi:hypothetical protein